VLEALCEAGAAAEPRLRPAAEWLLAQRGGDGRWANRYAYKGKMNVDIDVPGRPSKWVTLRALRVLAAIGGRPLGADEGVAPGAVAAAAG
jgi:hypothetical protein